MVRQLTNWQILSFTYDCNRSNVYTFFEQLRRKAPPGPCLKLAKTISGNERKREIYLYRRLIIICYYSGAGSSFVYDEAFVGFCSEYLPGTCVEDNVIVQREFQTVKARPGEEVLQLIK